MACNGHWGEMMLRWLALLLLLGNALLLFWYGQQRQLAEPAPEATLKNLHLLHELDRSAQLQPRELQCYRLGVFMSESELQRARGLLADKGFVIERQDAQSAVIGYHLRVSVPADAEARIQLLDELALAGWVPQTDAGDFVLGPFVGDEAQQAARTERQALMAVLDVDVRQVPIPDPDPGHDLLVSIPAGDELDDVLRQLLLSGWPGIKIEKKSCEGVARP
ncbi:hypothetical protein [Marinobacterium stanieri]|nr:hypothetical protein [Marinobacterium stanieri]